MKVSNTHKTTNLDDSTLTTIHEKTKVIPPEVSMAESVPEEIQTSYITVNISNRDTNVNYGEGV